MLKFALGADPEVFLQDAAGALIASCEKIGGSKEYPRPLPIGDGFAVQEDNVAVEYNIPPAFSEGEFVGNIQRTMGYLSDMIGEMGLEFNRLSAAEFSPEQLQFPQAMVFGCDPDYNAWRNGRVNPRPRSKNAALRSCGGHVHVGFKFASKQEIQAFIRRMDLYLAVPSTLMDNGELRKELYGKAGAFRYKEYGCEYRTLSNYWIFDPGLTGWVYRNTKLALESDVDPRDDHELVLAAINNNNKEAANALIRKYNIPMVYA